jgi:hypothetical protein
VRAEETDMQIYRLICESKAGITADELCTIYNGHSSPEPPAFQVPDRDTILDCLSRLKTYLLIDEQDECYTAVSITEYILKSQLKHMKHTVSVDCPEIEIVNGVIRVRSTDHVSNER